MHHEILLHLWSSTWCKFFYLGSSSSSDWLIVAQFCIRWWSWCWFLWHSRSIKLTSGCLSAWQQQLWEATDRSFSVLMWIRTWVCNCGHVYFVCLFAGRFLSTLVYLGHCHQNLEIWLSLRSCKFLLTACSPKNHMKILVLVISSSKILLVWPTFTAAFSGWIRNNDLE